MGDASPDVTVWGSSNDVVNRENHREEEESTVQGKPLLPILSDGEGALLALSIYTMSA
jgi:hypothetical protein